MKKWSVVLITILLTFIIQPVIAGTGKDKPAVATATIRIKVLSEKGEEIPGAKFVSSDIAQAVFSDAEGFVQLTKSGSFQINAIGFAPKTIHSKDLFNFSEVQLTPIN